MTTPTVHWTRPDLGLWRPSLRRELRINAVIALVLAAILLEGCHWSGPPGPSPSDRASHSGTGSTQFSQIFTRSEQRIDWRFQCSSSAQAGFKLDVMSNGVSNGVSQTIVDVGGHTGSGGAG